ncbi:MAG: peptidyl-prolyl cis-trans isomerase [Acidobacteria bacterium]|nr:peptidyl-prolyl cis-trans isomerase [Acidobacteriota bacterium]
MRRHQGWLKWSLALVVLTFVFFYVPDFLSPPTGTGSTADAVATVQGRPITAGDFSRAYNAQLAQFRNAYGGNMSPAMLRQLGMDQQVLRQMIDQQAVIAEATRLGITANDVEVRDRIMSIAAFQENGQFIGEQRYRQLLRLQRPPLTPAQFEDEIRNTVILDKMRATLTEWITVSDAEADAEYRRRNEKVSLELVSFPTVSYTDQVQVSDADLASWYEQQKETYRIGERRKVRYLLLDVQAIRSNITVPEQDIQRAYRQNIDQYSQPEQVRASHILLNIEGKDETAVRAKAEDLLKQLKAGADFETLARANSQDVASAARGGDLDFFARGRMVPEFEAVAFSLPVGQLSDVVRSQFGFHIIKTTDKKAAEVQPLDSVRQAITEQLTFERAQTRVQDLADAVAREVKTPADLDKAAAARGLKTQESPLFTRTEPIPGLGASPDVSEEAFGLDVGKVSGALPTGTGVAFITVTGTEDARVPALDEVKERATADLKRKRAQDLAREKATAAAATLKTAANFAAGVKAAGLSLRTADDLVRGAAIPEVGPSPAVDRVAFSLPVGAVSEPLTTPNGVIVLRVVKRTDVAADDLAKNREATRNELSSQKRAQFFASYMLKAKQGMGITVDQTVLRRLTT